MGRGNICVSGDYEGLYYIDWNNFPEEHEDEDGKKYIDYDLQRIYYDESINIFKNDFMKKFKSFSECSDWLDSTEKAILENDLFYIATEDNQWSIAIKLIQKDIGKTGLQKKHYQNYLEGIKNCLFKQFNELGVYSGTWTSGRIYKN